MALHSDAGTSARLVYNLTGVTGGLTASGTAVGVLPVGYRILRVSIDTAVAGTAGSSSPLISLGITGSLAKYVASAALVVSVGVASHTVVGTARATAAETILMTLISGTVTTNAAYDATLVVELIRVS